MSIQSQNPATGKVIKSFEALNDTEIDLAVLRSVEAHKVLRNWSFEQRSAAMDRAAQILEDEKDNFAKIMTLEMGKTFAAARSEVDKCAWVCRYYADHAKTMLADEVIETDASKSYKSYQPLGPVLAVMPWNFPFWQVFRFAAPALMAGNTGLLKHASNVPQCALAIEDIFSRAGFPDRAFQTLLISGNQVERVLRHDGVRAATLTGSEPAGASVASICGEEIKPTLLELGGSDAFIIMPSADIDAAVETGVKSRTLNNGQSCIAAKRFFIHNDIYDEVKAKFKEKMMALKVGDPMEDSTDIGPLVDREAREGVLKMIETGLKDGALRVCGAEAVDGDGAFFTPGIIENIPESSELYQAELFAPVALFFKVDDLNEAIKIANSSPFGLGSAIFTQDEDEQKQAIRDLEAGATFVNSMTASDPRLPFGGIKRSGYGRELSSEGIRAFCNIKTVSIA